jgi:hypothetical protein
MMREFVLVVMAQLLEASGESLRDANVPSLRARARVRFFRAPRSHAGATWHTGSLGSPRARDLASGTEHAPCRLVITRLRRLGVLLFIVCSACSSASSSGGSSDGGRADASSGEPSDAGVDAQTDSAGRDAESGPVSCQPVDVVCSADAGHGATGQFTYHCVTSWSAAQQPASSLCSYDPAIFVLPGCDGFDLVVDINVDVSYVYYYDRHTGALAGIGFNDAMGKLHCIAGTVVPVDISQCGWSPTSTSSCFVADAGAG